MTRCAACLSHQCVSQMSATGPSLPVKYTRICIHKLFLSFELRLDVPEKQVIPETTVMLLIHRSDINQITVGMAFVADQHRTKRLRLQQKQSTHPTQNKINVK